MKKILLADDDKEYIDGFAARLRSYDFEVQQAYDGEVALEILESYRPDLIILDILMPKMDGWEVCRQIKTNPDLKTIPTIIFTVMGNDVEALKSYKFGADDFVQKDFEFEAILASIRRQLSKRD